MQYRILTDALRHGFGTARELAAAGGISLDTAKRYRRGDTYPDAVTIARLMRHSRLVVQAMLRMAGLDDASLDAEQAGLVRLLLDLEAKRATRNANMAAVYREVGLAPPAWTGAPDSVGGSASVAADGPAGGAAPPSLTE